MDWSSAMERYLASFVPEAEGVLARLEAEGRAEGIPLIQRAGISFIRWLLGALRPERILEIGTAIGYSAIHMSEAAPQARIVTLEIDPSRAERAARHFAEAGMSERIRCVTGDALAILPRLDETFDFVLIDAAKGQYRKYAELCLPLLRDGGVIVSDNVLFRGLTALPAEQAEPRRRSSVRRLQEYNAWLAAHRELETVILPVGDGLALSRKISTS